MPIGLGAILAGASIPFAAGTTIELLDKLGLDVSGTSARAAERVARNANSAGWAGIMAAKDKGFADDLSVLSGTVRGMGDGRYDFLTGPSSETDAFLQQLFAKEGMRLNSIGAQAKQMSYLDMASKVGLMG